MSPIQQMLLGVGAVATKTYVDDVFSTYVYEGDGNSSRNITNNIDLLTEGGLVWYKSRSAGKGHRLVDTERGVTKVIESNDSNAEAVEATGLKAFLTNGFTVGSDDTINESGGDQASWSFRKSPGFFDVVTWTGNGVAGRQISHSLSSIPGCIMIKCTSNAFSWTVGHRSLNSGTDPWDYHLMLHNSDDEADSALQFNDTAPTSTHFTVGTANTVNGSGKTYVAYVFAGGESTAATARSVKSDGTDDYLKATSNTNNVIGTNDFTIELWVKFDDVSQGPGGTQCIVDQRITGQTPSSINLFKNGTNKFQFQTYSAVDSYTGMTGSTVVTNGQWYHVALCRNSGTIRLFVNGVQEGGDLSNSYDFTIDSIAVLGMEWAPSGNDYSVHGSASNFRMVVGTGLYTSSFKPPTEPLTSITNTKLLFCNQSTVTGTTEGTITANGNPTASTDSPFDDPAGFVFGDAGDQNVIKCGRYVGNGNSSPNHIYVGFEPQWVMIKAVNSSGNWWMYDTIRDTAWPPSSEQNDEGKLLYADSSGQEDSTFTIRITATGWYAPYANGGNNQNNDEFTYIAIRRPDGYVGKPPELGTDVFSLARGAGNPSFPCFVTGFPVDFLLQREFASTDSWSTGARLTGTEYMYTNSTDAGAATNYDWGSNTGAVLDRASSYQGWLWKRHAGFDVVTDKGNGETTKQIAHGLNAVPQMIWRKNRDGGSDNWQCYHFGLNGGTNPHLYRLRLNTNNAEDTDSYTWVNAPTATHFTVGSNGSINRDDDDFITMLFSSVSGISKCGYYSGNGSAGQEISVGFQPRFLIIKNRSASNNWFVLDTTRGWGSGNDNYLMIDQNDAQDSHDFGAPTSTGFTLVDGNNAYNQSGNHYIYYAHA